MKKHWGKPKPFYFLFFPIRYELQKYLVVLENDLVLNIPKRYWSIRNYNATPGHLVNHSFRKMNAKFDHATHPRFGPIRTIVSTKRIRKGEEILCDYNYSENSAVPIWYANVYEQEMKRKWPGELVYYDEEL